MWMGVLFFPRSSRSSERVGISRTIRVHFAVVNYFPHIELIVFDRFQLLVHFQTQKTYHATLFLFGAHGEWRSHFNCVTAQS
jgi:hypothetical protein